MSNLPTTDRLRHDIDRGRGGDKVDAIDPAAAPLGTDDEAAGTRPSPKTVKLAYDREIRPRVVRREGKDDDHAVKIYVGLIATIAAAIGLALWMS